MRDRSDSLGTTSVSDRTVTQIIESLMEALGEPCVVMRMASPGTDGTPRLGMHSPAEQNPALTAHMLMQGCAKLGLPVGFVDFDG